MKHELVQESNDYLEMVGVLEEGVNVTLLTEAKWNKDMPAVEQMKYVIELAKKMGHNINSDWAHEIIKNVANSHGKITNSLLRSEIESFVK